jgi:hypothetical protein
MNGGPYIGYRLPQHSSRRTPDAPRARRWRFAPFAEVPTYWVAGCQRYLGSEDGG